MLFRYSVRFNTPLFPFGVLVAVGLSRDEILDKLERRGCSRSGCLDGWNWSPSSQTLGHTAILPCLRFVLWFPHPRPEPRTIAHEAFHAAYGALPQIGIKLCDETEEVYAYFIDSLFVLLTDALRIGC